MAGGADVILTPERPVTVEALLPTREAAREGKDFSIVVVSEGWELKHEYGERRSWGAPPPTSSGTSGSAASARRWPARSSSERALRRV